MALKIYGWMDPVPDDVTRIVPRMMLRARGRIREYIATLKAMPPGMRGIFPWVWPWMHHDENGERIGSLVWHPDDRCKDGAGDFVGPRGFRDGVLWWYECEAGIEYCREQFTWFLERFKDAGVPIDACINDHETHMGYWAGGGTQEHLEAMMADPRWPGALHSDDSDMILTDLPAQVTRPTQSGGMADPDQGYAVFEAIMHRYYTRAIQRGIYEPLRAHYPDALCMNWRTGRIKKKIMEDMVMPHRAHWQWKESEGPGTHNHEAAYNGWHPAHAAQLWRDGAPVGDSQYIKFLATVKKTELAEDSTPRPLAVAIGPKGFPLAYLDYADDLMRHTIVRGIMPLLFNAANDDESDRHTDEVLRTCEFLGLERAEPVHHHLTDWADRFVWSCAKVGDTHVNRITMEDPAAGVRVRVGAKEQNLKPDESGVGTWLVHDASEHFEILGGAKRPTLTVPDMVKARPHLVDLS